MVRTQRLVVALLSIAIVTALPLFSSIPPAAGQAPYTNEGVSSSHTTIFSLFLYYLLDSLHDMQLDAEVSSTLDDTTEETEGGAHPTSPPGSNTSAIDTVTDTTEAPADEEKTAAVAPPDTSDIPGDITPANGTANDTQTITTDNKAAAPEDTGPPTPTNAMPDTEPADEQGAQTPETPETETNTTHGPDISLKNSTSNSTAHHGETAPGNASQNAPDNAGNVTDTAESDDELETTENDTENAAAPTDNIMNESEETANTIPPAEPEDATDNLTDEAEEADANESAGNDTTAIDGWTIMVYLDGDNSVDSYAQKELNEIAIAHTGHNVTVLVLYDGKGSGNSRLYRRENDSWENLPLQEINDHWGEEVNMGWPGTLEEFVSYGLANAEHGHYMLELWSHGYGWAGICRDETDNDRLTMDEIQQALAMTCGDGQKIDLLVYTACKMAELEVAYGLETYVDYFIASQESVPALGLPHTAIIERAAYNASLDAATCARQIVDAYAAFYQNAQTATIAAWRLDGLSRLSHAIDELAQTVSSEAIDGNMIHNAVAATPSFGGVGFIDIYDFALNIHQACLDGSPVSIAAQKVMENVSAVIHHEWHGSYHQNAHGISIYFPVASYLSLYGDLSFASSTEWDSFLQLYCDA